MSHLFKFETDFVDSLRCIPMQVRCNLDTCGIKLKLADWNHMTQAERENLVKLSCTTITQIQAYREYLRNIILQHTGKEPSELTIDPNPPWMNATILPITVQEKSLEMGIELTIEQWSLLTPLQRFALIKLSRPSHENNNFMPAIREFGLISS
ncbi:MAG: nitrate reductase maturation protein NarM [Calothrix sp. SM1_7_51]|nr:nitrate reductase maturation protein NarM [Calothrix sp. SM1_7_51]